MGGLPSAAFTHDADGNLTADGSTSFLQDAENRLVSASGARSANLSYDPNLRLFHIAESGRVGRAGAIGCRARAAKQRETRPQPETDTSQQPSSRSSKVTESGRKRSITEAPVRAWPLGFTVVKQPPRASASGSRSWSAR